MARQRKDHKEPKIKLKKADRSGPDPSQQTLVELAEQRSLFKKAEAHNGTGSDDGEALIGRFSEAVLWSFSLSMLHATLDVLVTHQYAVEIVWQDIISRTVQAFPIVLLLFYSLHPHPSPPIFLPRLSPKIQPALHQIFFFVGSVAAGCYLIHVSNKHGYYAVMKQAPPLGTLWIWSVIELDVQWAASSLIFCAVFLRYGGYSFL
ncbi:hypothetical protein B0O99DRAFT_503687 [Bisporella sp. PMI_857]|nr:hypothetical protein B0O99DRAFT_503687 [Bisporella sp. PMI_857]